MLEQRSKEWFDVRLGKFTASQINRLLSFGSRKMTTKELKEFKKENPKSRKTTTTCIGDGFYTYCFEKATELIYGKNEEEEITSYDMQRGIALEPLAFRKFKAIKDLDFIDVQEATFYPYGKHAGGSPDGLVGKDSVLEIKCPRSNKFFNLLKDGISAIDSDYMAQMQMQMLCTNTERAHFFNYLIFNGEEMWHEIVVPRDKKMIKLIENRIDEAIEVRNNYAKILMQNQQF